MQMPKVFNIKTGSPPGTEQRAHYIGRKNRYYGTPQSKWANPFVIGKDGTRKQVVEKYRVWIEQQIEQGEVDIEELRGKNLLCWCAPAACHGDVLLELANKAGLITS